jgi:glycosyltransferase involved in cell wall biosynthesis
VPVVASTADGNRELIRDGHNGLLAPSSSPDRFAHAAVRLLLENELRDRVVDQGTQTAKDFTLAHTIPQLESLYRDCLHRRNRQVSKK